jgi:putative lipoprotein
MRHRKALFTLLFLLIVAVEVLGEQQDAARDLTGTTWQLVRFQGSDDTTLTPDDRSKYTIAFERDGSLSVRLDCNRGRGTWKSSGPNQLRFGPLALTRAHCPPGSLHDQIAKQWQYVRSYVLKDGHLFLSLMADGGIYEFEPVSAQARAEKAMKGTATYRERMALPPNAVFEATLEDVSKADAPAEVVTRLRIERPGQPPIQFAFTYDSSRIQPQHRYAVRGRILVGETLLFTTDQQYPVLTSGHGNQVALILRRVSAASAAGAPNAASGGSGGGSTSSLENTYWKLIQLGDAPVTVASKQNEPHLILNSESRRVAGSGGCNRLTGSYQLNGDRLTFSQMASTMMACLQGMEIERAFLAALTTVTIWKIAGESLELFDNSGKLIARFEAGQAK